MLFVHQHASEPLNCFNIGPEDQGTTVQSIAEMVSRAAALSIPIRFTGGNRLGWRCTEVLLLNRQDQESRVATGIRSSDALERAAAENRAQMFDSSMSGQCR